MDSTFWAGIAIGTVLSFAASIAANLFHSRIVDVLDRGKIVSHQHLKKKAERFYGLIYQLHQGKRDKYRFMIKLSCGIITALIASCTVTLFAFIVLAPKLSTLGLFDILPWSHEASVIYACIFAATYLLFLSIRTALIFERIRYALDHFSQFDEQHRRRWGDPPT